MTDTNYYEEIYARKHEGRIDWERVSNPDIVDIVFDGIATDEDLQALGYLVHVAVGMSFVGLKKYARFEEFAVGQVADAIFADELVA